MSKSIEVKTPVRAFGRVASWFKLRKRLPLDPPSPVGELVVESDIAEGGFYVDKSGLLIRVLQKDLIFMGYASLGEYSNGALRWFSYGDALHYLGGIEDE